MRRSPTRDFVVGLFVLAGLGALAYLSLSIGGVSYTGRKGLIVYADFDEIGGLKERAPVVISGVKVGEVASIGLADDYRAKVTFNVDPTLKLPIDTTASIVTSGVLGDRYVSLQPGGDDVLLKPGDEITFVESAVILERLLGKLIHNTDVGGGNGNAGAASGSGGNTTTAGSGTRAD
jgi:phospholipid/cholesterol/gamma-HCH transport system substrate-binding protein